MLNKRNVMIVISILSMVLFLFLSTNVFAEDDPELEPAGDEDGTFTSVDPDALIVLDLSGSMNFGPTGSETYVYGRPSDKTNGKNECAADTTACKSTSTVNCSGGFCEKSTSTCNVDCTRLAIAKRALFNVLDNDNNNIIDKSDSDSLGIRMGFMRFKNGNDTSGSYSAGNNKLVTKISELGKETGTSYQKTFCGTESSCNLTTIKSSCPSNSEYIACENATGGTPLSSSLKEAKTYLDAHKKDDPSKSCRQKFVILVTDGADTYACPWGSCSNTECKEGCGCECQPNMYKRRREVVAATKALYNAGYKVFVIGFGAGMPDYLKYTLNWAAYYGGTENPRVIKDGSISAYSIPSGSTFPSGISSCQTDTATVTETCYSAGSSSSTATFKASNNDPGFLILSGYAFIATDADELTSALKAATKAIVDSTYSFTQSSLQAVRTKDENYVYEASFEPLTSDSFWIGHLKQYKIEDTGDITSAANWDAGQKLKVKTSGRNIYTSTLSANTLTPFPTVTSPAWETLFDTNAVKSTEIINFIRKGDTAYTAGEDYYGWKLGDIYHSSPLAIATPNGNFYDIWDKSTSDLIYNAVEQKCTSCSNCSRSFTEFLCSNIRTVNNGKRIIVVGANDGQLHAFSALNGEEVWSFIPPNLLSQLQEIGHNSHPTNSSHTYFVDGPLSAAEIWSRPNNSTNIKDLSKTGDEWHTYLIMAEGRGGIPTLWSKSKHCTSDFGAYYKVTTPTIDYYPHYCGYYALDVSNTTSQPSFMWRLKGSGTDGAFTSTDAPNNLGQAWSKMFMGRLRIKDVETWVGFIGGGYSGTTCSGSTCDDKSLRGKGFFVVNLSDGTILKSFTRGGPGLSNMNYDLVAGPTVVDYDGDGFLDTAYIGDTGGNIWRFKFCLASDGNTCDKSSWSGGLLFSNAPPAPGNQAIYTSPAVTFDENYNLWIFTGTGNKTDPTGNSGTERIMAIKDVNRNTSVSSANWTVSLTGKGEKVLSEPLIYDKKIYITTYIPDASVTDSCSKAGTAKIYIYEYLTGGELYSKIIGTGIPSSPVISIGPDYKKDVYVSMSEEAIDSTKVHTKRISDNTLDYTKPKSLIFWRDMRVQ